MNPPRLIANLDAAESRYRLVEDMVCRRGPVLMRAGGGPLIQTRTKPYAPAVRHTSEQRAKAIELKKGGKHSNQQIAEIIGSTGPRVSRLLYGNPKTARK